MPAKPVASIAGHISCASQKSFACARKPLPTQFDCQGFPFFFVQQLLDAASPTPFARGKGPILKLGRDDADFESFHWEDDLRHMKYRSLPNPEYALLKRFNNDRQFQHGGLISIYIEFFPGFPIETGVHFLLYFSTELCCIFQHGSVLKPFQLGSSNAFFAHLCLLCYL